MQLKKANSKLICVYICILLFGIVISFQGSCSQRLNEKNSVMILTQDILSKQSNMTERVLNYFEEHRFVYATTFSAMELERLQADSFSVFISKLADNGFSIYLNGQLIGSAGDEIHGKANIWNNDYVFVIPNNLIQENNRLEIQTYAIYETGTKAEAIYITSTRLANETKFHMDFYGDYLVLIAIGFVMFSSAITWMLFYLSKSEQKMYLYSAIATFLSGFYFMDYIGIDFLPIEYLIYKKIVMMSLFVSIGMYSQAIGTYFESHRLRMFSGATIIGFSFITLFSADMIEYKHLYLYAYWIILVNIAFWVVLAIKARKRHNQNYIFILGYTVLLGSAAINTLVDLLNVKNYVNNPFVYMVVLGMMPLLMAYENIHDKNIQLIREKELRETDFMKSVTDHTTGIWNQRYLFMKMQEKYTKYTIAMMDVDDFKKINDTYGHPAGDYVLSVISKRLLKRTRKSDVVSRYGGDEFVLLLYDCTGEQAFDLLESFRLAIEEKPIVYNHQSISVTLSIGVYTMEDEESHELVLKKVDQELYRAKERGKNRVSLFEN